MKKIRLMERSDIIVQVITIITGIAIVIVGGLLLWEKNAKEAQAASGIRTGTQLALEEMIAGILNDEEMLQENKDFLKDVFQSLDAGRIQTEEQAVMVIGELLGSNVLTEEEKERLVKLTEMLEDSKSSADIETIRRELQLVFNSIRDRIIKEMNDMTQSGESLNAMIQAFQEREDLTQEQKERYVRLLEQIGISDTDADMLQDSEDYRELFSAMLQNGLITNSETKTLLREMLYRLEEGEAVDIGELRQLWERAVQEIDNRMILEKVELFGAVWADMDAMVSFSYMTDIVAHYEEVYADMMRVIEEKDVERDNVQRELEERMKQLLEGEELSERERAELEDMLLQYQQDGQSELSETRAFLQELIESNAIKDNDAREEVILLINNLTESNQNNLNVLEEQIQGNAAEAARARDELQALLNSNAVSDEATREELQELINRNAIADADGRDALQELIDENAAHDAQSRLEMEQSLTDTANTLSNSISTVNQNTINIQNNIEELVGTLGDQVLFEYDSSTGVLTITTKTPSASY